MGTSMILMVHGAVQQAATRATRIDALMPDRREALLAAERYLKGGLHPQHEARAMWLVEQRAWGTETRLGMWRRLLKR